MKRVEEGAGELVISRGDSAVGGGSRGAHGHGPDPAVIISAVPTDTAAEATRRGRPVVNVIAEGLRLLTPIPRLGANFRPVQILPLPAAAAPSEPAGRTPLPTSCTAAPGPSACPCSTCPDSSMPTCFRTQSPWSWR